MQRRRCWLGRKAGTSIFSLRISSRPFITRRRRSGQLVLGDHQEIHLFSLGVFPPSAAERPPASSSFAAVIFNAGQCAGLGAKTTRAACATPRSNTFWQFPLKLPSSGFCPAKSRLMLSRMTPSAPISRPPLGTPLRAVDFLPTTLLSSPLGTEAKRQGKWRRGDVGIRPRETGAEGIVEGSIKQ